MARKPMTNEIFVGTNWNNMVVVRNPQGQSATMLQKHVLSFASKFGYQKFAAEVTSSNWVELYPRATRISDIGVKDPAAFRKADPIKRRGLVTRAILIKKDRILLYRWNSGSHSWVVAGKQTLFYTGSVLSQSAEKPEEKAVEMDATSCRVSRLVNVDNTDLTVNVINTLVRNVCFPILIDRDEHGNLVVESKGGKILVAA